MILGMAWILTLTSLLTPVIPPNAGSTVYDTTQPVISLEGSATMTLSVGQHFVDPGAYATDKPLNIRVPVLAVGLVDARTAGKYTVWYTAIDLAGNVATKKMRTITVK